MRALFTKRVCRQANPAWPLGFEVFEMAGPLLRGSRLVVRWRNRRRLPLVLAWTAASWGGVAAGIVTGELGWLLGALVGIALAGTYAALIKILNVTTLRVDHRTLVATTGPVPRWRPRRLRVFDIAQVFVTAASTRGEERRDENFVLHARTWDGEEHELVAVPTLEQARWLESRIEHHLGVAHVREPAEIGRVQVETLEASSWSA